MKLIKKKSVLDKNCIEVAAFLIVLIGYSLLMFRLFYRQCAHAFIEDIYMSDMKAYLQTILGQESGFDFPYPIFFSLGKFFLLFTNVNVACALAETILNSLSIIVAFLYIHDFLQSSYEKMPLKKYAWILSMVATYSLFFISMLYAPQGVYLPGMTHKYLGVFSPNPYHNATYMATRPFSIVTFFVFARILTYYEEHYNKRDFILFSVFLFLTTMTKPSFTLAFVSTAGIYMAWRIMYGRLEKKDWSIFLPSVKLALCFMPTFIALLYQFGGVFGKNSHAGEVGGIGFGFMQAWKVYMENIPLAIVLANAFTGLFLLLNWKQLKECVLYRFACLQMVVSLAELLILFEKGERFIHLNFSWGYMHGMFFSFMVSLLLLIKNTIEKKQKGVLLIIEWLAYGWHLCCGIIYFLYIYSGQFYYCF